MKLSRSTRPSFIYFFYAIVISSSLRCGNKANRGKYNVLVAKRVSCCGLWVIRMHVRPFSDFSTSKVDSGSKAEVGSITSQIMKSCILLLFYIYHQVIESLDLKQVQ